MIDDLDKTLEQLLLLSFGSPLPFDLSYAAPNSSFTPVSNHRSTLDCYLYDIQEDRALRSVEPVFRRGITGVVEKEISPVRVKISYCFTAWSPAQPTPGQPPEFDEHRLLGTILQVLLSYPTLPVASLVGSMREQPFPLATSVISPNSRLDSRDFWNAVGGQLRPSLDYSVTIAQSLPVIPVGSITTTLRVGYHQTGSQQEEILSIGGRIINADLPEQGIAGAEVQVQETGQVYMTDKDGQFVIEPLARGIYTLHASAPGFRRGTRTIQVPQPDGTYGLELSPA